MPITFFITDLGELYCSIEDTSPITTELFHWLSENRLEMGRKASFGIREESPKFSTIPEAQEWFENYIARQNKSAEPIPNDSIDAMVFEANRQGWLQDRNLAIIPELVSMYKNAVEYFMNMIDEEEPQIRETLMYHLCRYLFAKAVEGVILWGASSDGKISVFFHPKHITNDFETEVPKHLRQTVIESMSVGESLFRAHQEFVIQSHTSGTEINLREEMLKTLHWISRLGMSYALYNKYELLR